MPSGGRRVRSGPAPRPGALNRQRDGFVQLPAAGRPGDPPDWPVEAGEPTIAELSMWRRLWATPQALVWEADGTADQVAMYVRAHVAAMHPDGSAASRNVARQLANELLLTTPALYAARYDITSEVKRAPADPDAAEPPAAATGTDSAASVRSLFLVAPPDPED